MTHRIFDISRKELAIANYEETCGALWCWRVIQHQLEVVEGFKCSQLGGLYKAKGDEACWAELQKLQELRK